MLCWLSLQAEYEVTPDEKRKECGQELVNKYFNPKVAAAVPAPSSCLSSFLQQKQSLKATFHCMSSLS